MTAPPLGTVLDMPSGTLTNVLVERIDSIETTMALNDTAAEYINGIEVIKAFGKAQSSSRGYETLTTAA